MRGGEKEANVRAFDDGLCKLVKIRLEPGASIGKHVHETDSEMIIVLSGKGKVWCDGQWEELSAGSYHYCPMGHEHTAINDSDEDLVFYGIIPQHKA